MRYGILAAILAAGLTAMPAKAQIENLVRICGDPDAAPRDIVNFCQRALNSGKLSDQAAAQVRANLGVGFFELGQYRDAIAEYTRAIEAEPSMIAAYLNRARAYERLRQLREAAADYASALQLDPQAADAYLGRGAMLLADGDPGRSVDDFNRAIQLQPSWIAPYFNRGMAYLQLGYWAEADRDFTVVVGRSPQDAAAFLNRGRARAGAGMAEAGADYDRALEIDPEWGGAWFARGQYWDARGNVEAANRDFLRAYELGYPDPWLHERVRAISG